MPVTRHRESALWGLVGALSFLVLGQGYTLLADGTVGPAVLVGVALVVGAVAGVLAHFAGGLLARSERV